MLTEMWLCLYTTQGIGVIYRRDFDNPFTFLKRKKKRVVKKEDEK